jgi:uncharacterized membrane protein YphA (DoxX/SURF4 family)
MTLARTALAARLLTALALGVPTMQLILHAHGTHEHIVGWLELIGVVLFALPRVWPIGAALLLVIFAGAFAIHAAEGSYMTWLVYPAIIILLLWQIDRGQRTA